MSDFDEEEEDACNQAQADADEEEAMSSREEEEENVAVMENVAMKVAGKGKRRKGTVASGAGTGGVVKKSSLGSSPSSAKASALSAFIRNSRRSPSTSSSPFTPRPPTHAMSLRLAKRIAAIKPTTYDKRMKVDF
ncbi:hypothetical protein JAAARDRAFT_200328 [Jaapia argillacea MUCL 33604]|uniref:Uncharacterized protein n=1 Tax=Jaapia argillacea MUCL 33604 TaxID=933084 RepID=A0A067P8E3_9AGAM|nr:hypothetical protein JAAARDRAFT_200328 [Jaapia argillacea MUCL 33604]